jgi:hypothetical protein
MSKKDKNDKVTYNVVDESDTEILKTPTTTQKIKRITYIIGDNSPRTISMPLDEWSLERESEDIAKDHAEATKYKGRTGTLS